MFSKDPSSRIDSDFAMVLKPCHATVPGAPSFFVWTPTTSPSGETAA